MPCLQRNAHKVSLDEKKQEDSLEQAQDFDVTTKQTKENEILGNDGLEYKRI